MADSGLPNGGPPYTRPPDTVDELCNHSVILKKYINLDLLLPYFNEAHLLTNDEFHELSFTDTPEKSNLKLVSVILPSKGESALETFKQALIKSLEEEGSEGHRVILRDVFKIANGTSANKASSASEKEWLVTADAISEESEDFSLFLIKFSGELERGSKDVVWKRLRQISTYFCHLKVKTGGFLLNESVRSELCSEDLTFKKLFFCLDSKSKPPVISDRDVSMLHKFIIVLKDDESSKQVVGRLSQLLADYEQNSAIIPVSNEPPLSPDSASLKVKVTNAHSGNSKLKNGIKKSFFEALKFKFRGSGIGSVLFYWEFPLECYQHLLEIFENVHNSKLGLQQFRITKVETQQPNQIYLEMEITDPDLLQLSQHQHVVANDIVPQQEIFVMFLLKVDCLVGTYAESFLSIPRKEITRVYSRFEGNSFLEMVDQVVSQNSLHCFDISYIQLFLCSLLKWDVSAGNKYKEQLIALLREAQDYEPIITGSPLPCVNLRSRSRPVRIISCFSGIVISVSYDIMMTLKYALSQLLSLSLSAFHYSGWSAMENGFQISWNTALFNFNMIETACFKIDVPTGGLVIINEPDVDYPYSIRLTCEITDSQLIPDGSPLLVPDLEGVFETHCITLCR